MALLDLKTEVTVNWVGSILANVSNSKGENITVSKSRLTHLKK